MTPNPAAALTSRDDFLYRRSYRYVRLALIGLLLTIIVAAVWEYLSTFTRPVGGSCMQTSISAYYYTPARPLFSGSLLAVGICLIALKMRNNIEDSLLNFAGVGAIIVALVPTPSATSSSECSSTALDDGSHVRSLVVNNAGTVLIIGLVALILIGVIQRSEIRRSYYFILVAWALAITWWALLFFQTNSSSSAEALRPYLSVAHPTGAGALFLCIAIVVLSSHAQQSDSHPKTLWNWVVCAGQTFVPTRSDGTVPGRIFAFMVGGAAIEGLCRIIFTEWSHFLLVLELTELVGFALFWMWETIQPDLEDDQAAAPV